MYRRPKFLEVLLEIRREMAREADYDADLFAELARSGERRTISLRTEESDYPDRTGTEPPEVQAQEGTGERQR